ncbi:ABC transporter related [Petrotoga mobilis SJ95]|uniref:ABC transporter related n=1 Tax=Petrotoga mobilis (strain DSM 10674 / SJ95) TaxID=403833 RepID=A9BGJ3_PETMO|nr:ABC transporter ATP-binding protein [Petrotoga mobilis]ABX32043.1 ABC transporter related [Petrotoga mobilis SJ95]
MKKENNRSLRKLLKYSKKYLKYQKTPLILTPLLLLVSILSPFLIKYLIDDIIGNHEFSQILPFVILFTIVILSERLISFIVNYGYYKSTNLAARDEQIYMFKKILTIPIKEFSYNKIGDFMSRVLSDTLEVSFFLGAGISVITYNIIQLIVVSLVLLYLNWQLAVITFIMVPFYYFSLRAFDKNLQKSSELERIAYSDLTEELREKIEGLMPIKSFCKENFFSKQFSYISWIWVKKKNRLNMLNQSAEDFMSFIYELIPVLILGYGAYLILKGNATLGTLMGFYAYLGWIFTPIRNLSSFYIQMQRVRQVSERIFEIHDFPEENMREGKSFPNNDYPITYENVCFKYKDSTVLHDINLTIGTKEKVAIVGTSGAGKSSFVNLIPRFYEPATGKVMINGIDVKKYNLKQLRKNITIVRQDDYLFNMTVKENIMLDDEFTQEEFMKAVKKAKVDKFIGLLDEGYDTVVGERGSKLSDGQRQRVAIARALIREPKVLILDEATSGVDSQTEEEIFDELKEYEMTLIIISHRLSTIRKADKVILLKDGEIRGEGMHEELLKNAPIYKEIIESQLVV